MATKVSSSPQNYIARQRIPASRDRAISLHAYDGTIYIRDPFVASFGSPGVSIKDCCRGRGFTPQIQQTVYFCLLGKFPPTSRQTLSKAFVAPLFQSVMANQQRRLAHWACAHTTRRIRHSFGDPIAYSLSLVCDVAISVTVRLEVDPRYLERSTAAPGKVAMS